MYMYIYIYMYIPFGVRPQARYDIHMQVYKQYLRWDLRSVDTGPTLGRLEPRGEAQL